MINRKTSWITDKIIITNQTNGVPDQIVTLIITIEGKNDEEAERNIIKHYEYDLIMNIIEAKKYFVPLFFIIIIISTIFSSASASLSLSLSLKIIANWQMYPWP